MYRIITLAAAASLLTLAACDRNAETAPAIDDATAANADAIAADSAGSDASTSAPAAPSGATAADATSRSETMTSAESGTASPTGAGVGSVTDETRANAQRAAEETNLHPKPPMN
ncbi:hypothetical protein [Brevundimonas sp.]|uniref:hypothetical protein n=1 Tax=Brevundimonas sp. TaxID=1871086 RepID=UPI003D148857